MNIIRNIIQHVLQLCLYNSRPFNYRLTLTFPMMKKILQCPFLFPHIISKNVTFLNTLNKTTALLYHILLSLLPPFWRGKTFVCLSVTNISQEPVDIFRFTFTAMVPQGEELIRFWSSLDSRWPTDRNEYSIYKTTFWAITVDWIEIFTSNFFGSRIHLGLQHI